MSDEKITVLIVDDEKDLLDICVETFELEGFQVFGADNAPKAIEILKTQQVDVVVSDYMMPEMSGREFLEKLNSIFDRDSFPRFFFSTGAMDIDEKSLIDAGATGIIIKPFDIDELIKIVRES